MAKKDKLWGTRKTGAITLLMNIFRKPDAVVDIVKEAIEKKVKVVWMQEGVINNEAAEMARNAGLKVVMDRCTKKDHQSLFD